jgi:amphi-Trp domain-containing protein
MSYSEHKQREELTRQEAAERLTDIAYALTTGGVLKLDRDHEVSVPIADRVVLKRESKSKDGHVKLELELSWSAPSASPSTPPEAVFGE